MRLVVTKADRSHLRNCCNRQPLVSAFIDFQDEYEPEFFIFCPVCERCVHSLSFIDARYEWNKETWNPGDLIIPPKEPV